MSCHVTGCVYDADKEAGHNTSAKTGSAGGTCQLPNRLSLLLLLYWVPSIITLVELLVPLSLLSSACLAGCRTVLVMCH